jgi:hypothetical protein
MTINREKLVEKWAPVLDAKSLPSINDSYRKQVTAVLLENMEHEMATQSSLLSEAAPANSVGSYPDTGGVAKFDPVLIGLVRRAMPQMIAYDICGVQPMTQPTGLIFAMKSKYSTQGGTEALFNEANTGFSAGAAAQTGSNPVSGAYTAVTGVSTAAGEDFGGATTLNQMAFSIEKTSVTAVTRALKAEYSIELAQDMKSIHGLDAEAELSNILSSEILAEINREVVRQLYITARPGAIAGTTAVSGEFDLDVDSNGRWSVERFKGLMFQIEREANVIAQQTRRGRGNFIICSADVASALAMAGVLDYTPALDKNNNLKVDEATSTFAGVLNGKYKVYIDPFSANGGTNPQYFVVGYKGASPFDAGMFYCPYVPLQLVRAVDPSTFQPKIAFKTRYGLVSNPFVTSDNGGTNMAAGTTQSNGNMYYRRVAVRNIM